MSELLRIDCHVPGCSWTWTGAFELDGVALWESHMDKDHPDVAGAASVHKVEVETP